MCFSASCLLVVRGKNFSQFLKSSTQSFNSFLLAFILLDSPSFPVHTCRVVNLNVVSTFEQRLLTLTAITINGLLFGLTDTSIYNNVLICERQQNSRYRFFVTCSVMKRNFPTEDFRNRERIHCPARITFFYQKLLNFGSNF